MNFFGHSVIAKELATTPAFIFGSMLPDFVSMSGGRLDEIGLGAPQRPQLVAGVEVHHATDAVFHSTAFFLRYCSALTKTLEERGVRRGTAMAVGHIGVELILDRWLLQLDDPASYLGALAYGAQHSTHVSLTKDGGPRLGTLMTRLVEYELDGYKDIEVIVMRLRRALAGRPRLAVDPAAEETIGECLEVFDAPIRQDAAEWRETIRRALRVHPRYVAASERMNA